MANREIKTSGDYHSVIESYNQAAVDQLYAAMSHVLKGCTNLKQGLLRIREKLTELTPCVTDDYSALRYAHFFMKRLSGACPTALNSCTCPEMAQGIEQTSLSELQNVLLSRAGESASSLLKGKHHTRELFPVLFALSETGASIDMNDLLPLTGKSPYIDSLIGQIIRTRIRDVDPGEIGTILREHIHKVSGGSALRFCIDIAAEHKIAMLNEGETARFMKRFTHDTQIMLALLRYMGVCGTKGLLTHLYRMLEHPETPLPVLFGCIDVLAQLGEKRASDLLQRLCSRLKRPGTSNPGTALTEFIEAAIEEIESRGISPRYVAPKGLILVQCMFYGDVALPGQGGGGGLTTFLNDLGNSLSSDEALETVYTLVLLPLERQTMQRPLIQQSGDHHYVVRVPVSFSHRHEAMHFMVHEFEIMHAVHRALERYVIDPDIFHIRYLDNASRAVTTLGKRLNKKVALTLTPDPHRNFVGRQGTILYKEEKDVLRDLNKVWIADSLVEQVDGFVLIGHNRKNDQILPYFPQLWLDQEVRRKTLRIMAEGVRTDFSFLQGESMEGYIELLTNHGDRYTLDPETMHRPIILNVGRLNPLKGQYLLVEAWVHSNLSDWYNLVLVGGNLEDPDPVEAKMLEKINRIMGENGRHMGRFCHIGALPNPRVRLLEQSIMERIRGRRPNVYVCSSFKEEFGISILEAMAAGFLIVGPLNGGVSGYVQHGRNGFLVHTDDAGTLRRDLEQVLDPRILCDGELREIARRGTAFVKDAFNIQRIAQEFSEYYEALV